jgi:hypothetical protein
MLEEGGLVLGYKVVEGGGSAAQLTHINIKVVSLTYRYIL